MLRNISYLLTLLLLIAGGLQLAARHVPLLSSDALYPLSLYRDSFERSFQVWGWNLTPAPYFFPDLLVMFPLFGLFSDPGYAFAAYEVLTLLALWCLVALLTRAVHAFDRKSALNTLYLGVNCSLLATLACLLLEPQLPIEPQGALLSSVLLFPTYHNGALLCGLGFWYLWLRELRHPDTSRAWPWGVGILSFIATASDLIIVPQFILPTLILSYLGDRLKLWPAFWRARHRRLAISCCLGILAGVLCTWSLTRAGIFNIGGGVNHVLSRGLGKSMEAFWHDLPMLLRNYWLFLLPGALLACVCIKQLHRARSVLLACSSDFSSNHNSPAALFLCLLIAASVICSLLAAVANGRYENIMLMRQFIPTMILPWLFISLFLSGLLGKQRSNRIAWLSFSSIAATTALLLLTPSIAPTLHDVDRGYHLATRQAWSKLPAELALPYPEKIRCLDTLAQKHGWRAGVGDYWTAKLVRELSHTGLQVNQVDRRLRRYQWISNPDWYTTDGSRERQPPQYQFIISANLDPELLARHRKHTSQNVETCGNWEIMAADIVLQ